MGDVAGKGFVRAAGEVAVAEILAGDRRDLGTDRIPGDVAAGRIDVADVLAAVLVAAGAGAVGEAAVAGVRVTADRNRARVLGAGAGIVVPGHVGTHQIPGDVAAEGVVEAHRIAAVLVVALRGAVGEAAVACARITAIPVRTAVAAGALAGELDASLVPGGDAAERIVAADVVAATLGVAQSLAPPGIMSEEASSLSRILACWLSYGFRTW